MTFLKTFQAPATAPARLPWRTPSGRAIAFLFLVLVARPSQGQELQAPERNIKATFLYNFTKLVNWPTNTFTNTSAPIIIGVLGKDPFGAALNEVVKGKTVNDRPVLAVRFKSVDEIKNCHVLYISESERRRLEKTIQALRSRPILTVGDLPGFETQGMITLVKTNETINLHINLEAVTKSGLSLSSRLLRLDKTLKPAQTTSISRLPATPN